MIILMNDARSDIRETDTQEHKARQCCAILG